MWKFLDDTGKFLWKHKSKIVVGAAVVGSIVWYYQSQSADTIAEEDAIASSPRRNGDRKYSSPKKSPQRQHLLQRADALYDFSLSCFLPTIRTRISEIVDTAECVRQLKELRAQRNVSNGAETQLWQDIKISSFTIFFTHIYVLATVCLIIRVQMHIFIRYAGVNDEAEPAPEFFQSLMSNTYAHILKSGLTGFASTVRSHVQLALDDWTVESSLNISYQDVKEVLLNARRAFEDDSMRPLLQELVLPVEEQIYDNTDISEEHQSLQRVILAQTWDIIESPLFASALAESISHCYALGFEHLNNIFFPEGPAGGAVATIPLASLLPQIKAVAGKLLPRDVDKAKTVARKIISGSHVEELVLASFDAVVVDDMFHAETNGHTSA